MSVRSSRGCWKKQPHTCLIFTRAEYFAMVIFAHLCFHYNYEAFALPPSMMINNGSSLISCDLIVRWSVGLGHISNRLTPIALQKNLGGIIGHESMSKDIVCLHGLMIPVPCNLKVVYSVALITQPSKKAKVQSFCDCLSVFSPTLPLNNSSHPSHQMLY